MKKIGETWDVFGLKQIVVGVMADVYRKWICLFWRSGLI